MEWIGALAGAVATVLVAVISLVQPQKETDRLKELAEARKLIAGRENGATRRIDMAIGAIADDIRRLPQRRFEAQGITAFAAITLSLVGSLAAWWLHSGWGVIDASTLRMAWIAAFPIGVFGIYLGVLWVVRAFLKSD